MDLRVGERCPYASSPSLLSRITPPLPTWPRPGRQLTQPTSNCARSRPPTRRRPSAAATASSDVENTRKQIERSSASLTGAPSEADVAALLETITAADETLSTAQKQARTCRAELVTAEKTRSSLIDEETKARAELNRSRDSLVQLGAPAIIDTDLAAAWQTLTTWAQVQRVDRSERQADLDAAAAVLQQQLTNEESTLAVLLAEHGIIELADPARAATAVATHRERAANQLAAVRDNRNKAAQTR